MTRWHTMHRRARHAEHDRLDRLCDALHQRILGSLSARPSYSLPALEPPDWHTWITMHFSADNDTQGRLQNLTAEQRLTLATAIHPEDLTPWNPIEVDIVPQRVVEIEPGGGNVWDEESKRQLFEDWYPLPWEKPEDQ